MEIKDQVVLILGASSGIGEGIARAIAEKRPKGLILAARRTALLEDLVNGFKTKYNTNAVAIQTDVTSTSSLKALIEQAIERYSSIDIVVNSAGVIQKETPIEQVSQEERRRIIETNLTQSLELASYLMPIFKKQKSGIYIVISSQAGQPNNAFPKEAEYSASKAGIDQGIRCIDAELLSLRKERNEIYAFSIAPGFINTLEARAQFPDVPESTWQKAPTPEEFSKVILHFIENPELNYKKGRKMEQDQHDPVHLISTIKV